jgi:hypothetical protein
VYENAVVIGAKNWTEIEAAFLINKRETGRKNTHSLYEMKKHETKDFSRKETSAKATQTRLVLWQQ